MTSWVRFSLKHPVPTIVIFLFALVVGAVSLSQLSVDLYPAMEFPLAIVSTKYEGAGPQEVEQLVTRPLEEVMGTLGGVTSIQSQNYEGQSVVIVRFDWGTDMDQATLSMREKVDQVKGYFPDDVGSPMVFKIDPAALPVLTIGVSGDATPVELKAFVEDRIKSRLERIDGVASVSVEGGTEREIRVTVDPARLSASGISISQVAQALRYENLNLPGGQVKEGKVSLLVRTVGQFSSVDQIRDLRLGPVRLGDVAEIEDTFADYESKVWINGKAAIGMDVQKQTGANAVTVAEAIKAELATVQKELPAGYKVDVLMDQSRMVLTSVGSITDSGWQGGLLAILVLLLFLRHFRATLAVALAIPISVVTTFGPLFFGGVTLNMISMGGLSLGVGMMVDSAIVVLENIFRHKSMGKDPQTAALDGTSEVALAVSSSQFTSIVVFLPVVWITGLAQMYFRELALAVTFSLLVSMVVALTLVPIASTWLLRERKGPARPPSKLYLWLGVKLEQLNAGYSRALNWAMARKWQVIGIGVSALVVAAVTAMYMGMEFIPSMDTAEFRVNIKLPPGTRLEETEKALTGVREMIQAIPEVRRTYAAVGSAGGLFSTGSKSNEGYVVALMSAKTERSRSLFAVMEDVRAQLVIPGARVAVAMSGSIDPGGVPIEVQIKGDDLGVLESLAGQVATEVRKVPGTREVETSVDEGLPEVQVTVDRARAASYYLSPSQIAMAVQAAVKGQDVSKFRVGGKEYDIKLQATEESRHDVVALSQLPIATPAGSTVPLGDVAEVKQGLGPTRVEREDQTRVVKVNAQMYNRDLGSIMADIEARLSRLPLPPGYSISYGGQKSEMDDAFGGLAKALSFSIILVYLVMAAQFESFFHPLVIMGTVPMAFVGAILGLVLTGRSLDISGMIGVILLVGIAVNNAIVLIDYVNQLRAGGMDRDQALRVAGPTRLRPVLMTTLTTLLGLLPLALGIGEGAELMAPMATVVMGGLGVSTLLTLIVIPVMYSLMDDGVAWLKKRLGQGGEA